MKQKTRGETAHLSAPANKELDRAMIQSLEKITAFFDAPFAAKQNLLQEMKTANNLVSSYAKIRQSESGHEMVRLQIARALCGNKEEFQKFIEENMPHLTADKLLGK